MTEKMTRHYVTGTDLYGETVTGHIYVEGKAHSVHPDEYLFIRDFGGNPDARPHLPYRGDAYDRPRPRYQVGGHTNEDEVNTDSFAEAEAQLLSLGKDDGYPLAESYIPPAANAEPMPIEDLFAKRRYVTGPSEDDEQLVGFIYEIGEPNPRFEHNAHIVDWGDGRIPEGRFWLVLGNQQWVSDDLSELEAHLREWVKTECSDANMLPSYPAPDLSQEPEPLPPLPAPSAP